MTTTNKKLKNIRQVFQKFFKTIADSYDDSQLETANSRTSENAPWRRSMLLLKSKMLMTYY